MGMFPVALYALTPTSPPGKPPASPPKSFARLTSLGTLADARDLRLLLLDDRRVLLEDLAVLPEALLAARETSHELRVASGFLDEALLVRLDVLPLPDVELLAGARGNVPRRSLLAGHRDLDVRELDVGNVRELDVGDGLLELVRSLVELVADGGVANGEGRTAGRDAGRDARRGLQVRDRGCDDRHGDAPVTANHSTSREGVITRDGNDSWIKNFLGQSNAFQRASAARPVVLDEPSPN